MSFTYLERQELNKLSQEVFGRSSFWYNQLHKKGVKKTKEQLKENPLSTRKYFTTFDEVKTEMLRIKSNTEKFIKENSDSIK